MEGRQILSGRLRGNGPVSLAVAARYEIFRALFTSKILCYIESYIHGVLNIDKNKN